MSGFSKFAIFLTATFTSEKKKKNYFKPETSTTEELVDLGRTKTKTNKRPDLSGQLSHQEKVHNLILLT